MILEKTIKTLFTKPAIILMTAAMLMLPLVMAALQGGAEYVDNLPDTYDSISVVFSLLFTLIIIGPLAEYTYRVCANESRKGFLSKGIFKNTIKIIIVILAARLIGYFISGTGFIYGMFFGSQITGIVLFAGVAVQTFETVAQVSIAATDSFTDAVDHAVSVTKSIYLRVAVIVLIFGLLEYALFSNVGLYKMTETEFLLYNIFYGLFDTFTTAFVLVYCAHHFVEDKMINDAAMSRLNNGSW